MNGSRAIATLFLGALVLRLGSCATTHVEPGPPAGKIIPGTILAVEFDGAFDADSTNRFLADSTNGAARCDSLYPNASGVDMYERQDPESCCVVGLFAAGEWLDYSVTVERTAWYRMYVRYACAVDSTSFHLEVDDLVTPAPPLVLYRTGSTWAQFATAHQDSVLLQAGPHTLRVVRGMDWLDLHWIRFEYETADTGGVLPDTTAVPDTTWRATRLGELYQFAACMAESGACRPIDWALRDSLYGGPPGGRWGDPMIPGTPEWSAIWSRCCACSTWTFAEWLAYGRAVWWKTTRIDGAPAYYWNPPTEADSLRFPTKITYGDGSVVWLPANRPGTE